MATQYRSVEWMSIMDSGHHIVVEWCDEETHEINRQAMRNPDDYQRVTMRLRKATDEDDTPHGHGHVEERWKGDELLWTKPIGQPRMDKLARTKEWSVDKQH